MTYPQELIHKAGGVSAFAERASLHPDAPRKLTRDAVYMWQQRNAVPFAWRPVVREMAEKLMGGSAA